MCGIAGVFAPERLLTTEDLAAVRGMTDALAHRGPDGDGFHHDAHGALGHRRLAIIDRAGGQQPMTNEDGSCWIVFNGEIYNHRDLRPVLEGRGHRFRTACDTEVILHAYEEYGPECVERLEGMFAFAIYDARRRALFAARDRLGKKPFFYTMTGGAFWFASELPALAHAAGWRGDVDLTALEGYLSLGYFLAPGTIYKDAIKLLPAHWLRVSAEGRVETRRYWDVVEFDTDARTGGDLVSAVDAAIGDAVASRLESEVPLGAFLSGGIDSGLIASYMADARPDAIITTSVGFGGHETGHYNELDLAALTAAHVGSRHYPEIIEPRLDECLGPVTAGLGEPLADASAIPTWYVSRAARRHVTVALSGDGGDETFAGYDFRYVPHALEHAARRWMPRPVVPALGWMGARWPRSPRLPKPLRAGTLLENLGRDPAGAYYSDLAFLKAPDARRLMGGAPDADVTRSPVYAAVTDPYRRCPSRNPVQRAEYADLMVYLPNDPLVKVDRMSMAHGLEVRCPLLDRRVVELAFRIPAERKQSGRRGKVLLRALAKRRLPAALWNAPKRGFAAPIGAWIAGPSRQRFSEEVLRPGARIASCLDVQELRRRFETHDADRASSAFALWAAWVLERWWREAERAVSPTASRTGA